MAQPRHRDAQQVRLVRQRCGCEFVGVPGRCELVRVDVHADAECHVAEVTQGAGEEGRVG